MSTLQLFSGIACILDGAGILIWARLSRKNAKLMAGIALILAITSKDKFIGKPDTEETGIAQ